MGFDNFSLRKFKFYPYITALLKWSFISVVIGLMGAIVGTVFHYAVDFATSFRTANGFMLYFLPLSGILIVYMYKKCRMENDKGTNAIISAVRTDGEVGIATAPLVIISTALTHLCGGSSGREGAALQIGGTVGSFFARLFKVKKHGISVCIMCGMASIFSAVFTTPLTAAVFALEVTDVGLFNSGALFPILLSSLVSFSGASFFGVEKTAFSVSGIPSFGVKILPSVILSAILISLVGILFIFAMHSAKKLLNSKFPNPYIRILVGSAVVILLTLAVGVRDYNGAGMDIVKNAVEKGIARPEAFLLKILFTAITLGAGFKGGEIVPTFFIGSSFGFLIASPLGLAPSFSAALGLVSLFCAVSNCPISAIFLSIELFGAEGIPFFALAVAVSYIASGNSSLYSSQRIIRSKLNFDINVQ